MRPQRILLDLDGVCNRSPMSFLKYVGCPVDDYSYRDYPVGCGWDLVEAANRLHPSRKFSVGEFWDTIDRRAWATAPESAEFKWLLGHCEALVGRKSICILTSPTIDPDCLAGKLEWIHSHFPKWMHRQFLIGPRKHFCARPDALLIDDADHNVAAFREHGGQAILVPRPWNSLIGTDTFQHLAEQFDALSRRELTV
ncbi:MAG: hypothetical protein DWQ31_16820 [Planctomycetota bacterium]|nr:MAG: hypothetical protein DWQ31_16820 [Planctomycetota bacterium]REJ92017.1 MAG: hypothetical protein DWQ35_12770 [Planctomycetota bacterium]REK28553.1 MAG: hypothetical protein DWQ42_04360 [Planctomycetota bacterium]REK39168.1 MAG: hypothetical protein DWQ46_17945 [Planctomycetota bacterium]